MEKNSYWAFGLELKWIRCLGRRLKVRCLKWGAVFGFVRSDNSHTLSGDRPYVTNADPASRDDSPSLMGTDEGSDR